MKPDNQHAARLREIAEGLPTVGRTRIIPENAASMIAGAEALEKVEHMRRFAEALTNDGSPVLLGFALEIYRILDAEDTAALARLEGK